MKTVLMVDDEAKIRDVVVSYLKSSGFQSLEAETGQEAISAVRNQPIDLIILDLMLPDLPGEQVCQEIRRLSAVPILMLTAKVSEQSRINGLSLGADDYLIKPFDPRELIARIRAILRRTDNGTLLADRISFHRGELQIDALQQKVFRHEEPIALTPNEYKLLLVMARHPHRHFTREELIEKVLGFDYEGDVRTIDQHIKNLRQKIEPEPKTPKYLITVYGTGYRFVGDSE